MELNETNNKTFLRSIVWQCNKITCSMFGHKIPVNIFFIVTEMPGRVSDQAKLLPVITSNLPDNCPMTDCYLQACDGVVCARKNANVLLTGEVIGKKCNGHRKSFQKRSITLKNAWLPPHFMLRNGSGKPIQHMISCWL